MVTTKQEDHITKQEDHIMRHSFDRTVPVSMNLILVVASDLDLGYILTMILREEVSQEVLLVADCKEVIEFCRLITPQLVLIDEQVFGIHAEAFYKRLCQSVSGRRIPGLLLAESISKDDWNQQHLHCMKKPFQWDQLLQNVKTLLDA